MLQRAKREKINSLKLVKPEQQTYGERHPLDGVPFFKTYRPRNHLGEMLNRFQGIERFKPSSEELIEISSICYPDYSMYNIYSNTTYKQRKHLVYIFCTLNNITTPLISQQTIETIIFDFKRFLLTYKTRKKNLPPYNLVLNVIVTRRILRTEDGLPLSFFIYFKRRKSTHLIEESVLKCLNTPLIHVQKSTII